MLLAQPPETDLKGKRDSEVVPGFPTEDVRHFESSSPSSTSPILLRRISVDDKAKVNAISMENDSTGWLKKKLFKKEITWPRELYLNVLACRALVPPNLKQGQLQSTPYGVDSDVATASVTTEGDGDAVAGSGLPSQDGIDENIGREGEPAGVPADQGTGDGKATGEYVKSAGDGAETSGTSAEAREEDEAAGVSEPAGERMAGMSCFVKILNATTGRELQTQTIEGGPDPGFQETFIVPCQGPRDAVVLRVYVGEGEQFLAIGEAALPLDARVLGVSHPVLLSVKDKQGRSRGFLRVEAFWVDEAKPRKETGEFYYRVVHPSGVSLRKQPAMHSERSLHVLEQGEVFMACERQWHVADRCSPIFVKIQTAKDRWARSGWCFETRCDQDGRRERVLERASRPRRKSGKFFYRVCNANGARLHAKADAKSSLHKEVFPQGQVLEASEKWTPAGSSVTFVTIDNGRGFAIQKLNEKETKNEAGEAILEETECPIGITISSAGLPESKAPDSPPPRSLSTDDLSSANSKMSASRSPPKPRTARAASMISAAEAKAAAAAVQRLYRVRDSAGVRLTRTPDVEAPAVETMGAGTAFYGKAEVVKHYEGMGDVAFIMRGTDGLWVRANKPGVSVLLDYFTNREEPGAFTYRVIHENGVVVRTAPGLDAPPVKPRRILPVSKLINVCERLTRAEDIMNMSRPPVFLRLAGNDGWVFDRGGHTTVCEDVTVKSRIATANAITAEAARLQAKR